MSAKPLPTLAELGECAKARELLDQALNAGWGGALQRYTGDGYAAPCITVTVQHVETGEAYRVTWSGKTGSWRMSDALAKGGPRRWSDTTLKAVKEALR